MMTADGDCAEWLPAASKAALNALTIYYAHALAEGGIKVNALAPGLRRTDLNATAAASEGDPAEAAAGAVRLALLPDDGPSGGVLLLGRDAGPLVEAAPNDLSVILGGACC